MRPASLLFALLAGLALAAPAAAQDAARRGAYFVEFRARGGGILGHTFIVYGRVDGRGRELERHYAGLYPRENWESALMSFGPLVVAPAYVGVDRKDRDLAPTVTYRVSLRAGEYARLRATVQRLEASKPRWHLVFHNCNDFVAQVAQSVGLWTLPAWGSPYAYVRSLRAVNGP